MIGEHLTVSLALAAALVAVPGVGDEPGPHAPESPADAQGVPWTEEAEEIPVLPIARPVSVREIVAERAAAHGASFAVLSRVIACESRWNPSARGDYGRSHGLAQLNDQATGLLHHFHAVGYGSAYNAWEAADYLARVAVGTWAAQGITLRRWSCY